jgi:serpin B
MRHFIVAAVALLLTAPQDVSDTTALVKGNTQFALDLYATLRVQDGNLFFSPYSISTALAMTYAGAGGTTASQIARTLHFPLPSARLHPVFAALNREVIAAPDATASYELYVANALWAQQGGEFRRDFLEIGTRHYDAGLNRVDFAKGTEDARNTINRWVAEQTRDKIKELLGKGVLDDMTRLVLTNAIYFRGAWEQAFNPTQTREGDFRVSDTMTVKVPLMYQDSQFRYMGSRDAIGLDMPYETRNLSMILLLPPEKGTLADFEKTLTADNLENWVNAMKPGRVRVMLPTFQIESQFSLRRALSTLGMPLAFSTDADLSGITGRKNLSVSEVVHKGFVEVNEVGTEAAAATGVVSMLKSAPPQFIANRPFVFLIRDNRNGSVLFLGRVVNPAR